MVRKRNKSIVEQAKLRIAKLAARLDNVGIFTKFMLIILICVIMPTMLSIGAFIIVTDNYTDSRDRRNLENSAELMLTELRGAFEESVIITNTLASSPGIIDAADTRFENELDYYRYAESYNLRNYVEIYVTQRDYVENLSVYLYNDTVSNGGIIRRIDSDVRAERWYKLVENSDNIVTICVDNREDVFNGAEPTSESKPVISVIRRVSRGVTGGAPRGFVKVDMSLDKLADRMRQMANGVAFYLMDYGEDLVYDPGTRQFIYGAEHFKSEKTGRGFWHLESGFSKANYMENWGLLSVYDHKENSVRKLWNVAVIVGINIAVGLFMSFVVALIYTSLNRRIAAMMESMREAENGEFREILLDAGDDELGALTRTYNHMVARIDTLINDVYKLEIKNTTIEAEKAKAELAYMQSQVNPHFIFNVLNAMLVVSVKKGYVDLSEQISGLAKMFRRLLDWSDEYEPLSKEMGFVETYLKLEKFRFGDKFRYSIRMDDEAGECGIPKMIVQPLVENACRHGLQGITEQRVLDVLAEYEDGVLTVSVQDNGKGIEPEKLEELVAGLEEGGFEGHIGLKNVYRRLKIHYDGAAGMTIYSEPGIGTRVTIRIDYSSGREDSHV